MLSLLQHNINFSFSKDKQKQQLPHWKEQINIVPVVKHCAFMSKPYDEAAGAICPDPQKKLLLDLRVNQGCYTGDLKTL